MDPKTNDRSDEHSETAETHDRREAVRRLGKFAAYAAPFTLLAFTRKADAATGGGPGPLKHH